MKCKCNKCGTEWKTRIKRDVVPCPSCGETIQKMPRDTFTDLRDGKIYRVVKIAGMIWMAENLDYEIGDSWYYENDSGNGSKYGRLYNWETAESGANSLSVRSDYNVVCGHYGVESCEAFSVRCVRSA